MGFIDKDQILLEKFVNFTGQICKF